MSLTKDDVNEALQKIEHPYLHRSLGALELIKNTKVKQGKVQFELELTSPACPAKDELRDACVDAVKRLDPAAEIEVNVTAVVRGAPTEGRKILKTVKNIVAVASGKGGVAKSTTAVNLALALSRAGASVGILDADIYGPSVPTMLQIDEEPTMGPNQQLNPARGMGLQIISIGFFVQEGQAAILRGPMVSGYVGQFLSNVNWGNLDYLIIDYPPGTGDIQLTLSQQAPITGAVLTTTPQKISLIDVHKALGMFETTKIPVLGVVETMSYFVCDGCNKRHDIFRSGGGQQVADAAGIPFLGAVPIDPQVAVGGDSGSPIIVQAPDSPAARAYLELAGAVAAQLAVLNIARGAYLETFSLKWDQS